MSHGPRNTSFSASSESTEEQFETDFFISQVKGVIERGTDGKATRDLHDSSAFV